MQDAKISSTNKRSGIEDEKKQIDQDDELSSSSAEDEEIEEDDDNEMDIQDDERVDEMEKMNVEFEALPPSEEDLEDIDRLLAQV